MGGSQSPNPAENVPPGTIYIDTTDPLNWLYYTRQGKDNGWSAPGVTLTSATAKALNKPFPGYRSDAPPADQWNWSGFKRETQNDFYATLKYVALGAGIVGTLGTIWVIYKKMTEPSTNASSVPTLETSSDTSSTRPRSDAVSQ